MTTRWKRERRAVDAGLPCEGTGYEIGGVSILKGARNLDNAKLFVDWALSKEAQELSWKKGQSYQILTNTTAETSPLSLKLQDLKLINYDMDKYGAANVRKELISKWVNEVKWGNSRLWGNVRRIMRKRHGCRHRLIRRPDAIKY